MMYPILRGYEQKKSFLNVYIIVLNILTVLISID